MNSRLFSKASLALAIAVLLLHSCSKDETNGPAVTATKGIFVVNEGNSSVSSSISYFSTDSLKVQNDIYSLANDDRPLGSYAQSMDTANNKFYIMVGGSHKVTVVDKSSFKSVTDITGFYSPRYFQLINNQKAYVSQWGGTGTDGSIAIIELSSSTIKKTITDVGSGPEKMLLLNQTLYVVNAGGWGNDSAVTVIDPATDAISKRIQVGYNPNSIVADKNGMIWVLCSGKTKNWSIVKAGSLVKINPSNGNVEKTFIFPTLNSPSSLTINSAKDKLTYIYNGGVYQQDIAASELDNSPKLNRWFYHIAIDRSSDILYATDPKDYSSEGLLVRFNSSFAKIDSFKVGIGAGELFFN